MRTRSDRDVARPVWFGMTPMELLALGITILLHFANLGRIEYFGEDEPWVEFIASGFLQGLATGHWRDALTMLVSGWHPPVRYLATAAGIALFGANEFGGRFFHAASGIAIFFALRRMVSPAWGRVREAVLLLYAVTGPAVLHRMNGGQGIFIALAVWTFVMLETAKEQRSGPHLVVASVLLPLALMTSYDGIVFYPYVFWRLWRLRREAQPWLAAAAGIPLLPLAGIAAIFAIRGPHVQGMGLGQLTMRVGTVPSAQEHWHIGQKFALYTSAMSPFYILIVAVALILCGVWMVRRTREIPGRIRRFVLFYALHIIVWLVVLPVPMSHTLWDYPVWTTWGGWAWGEWWVRRRWIQPVFLVMVVLTGMLTFEGFNRLGDYTKKPTRIYASVNVPACPSSERWGQRALAKMLDARVGSDETVVTSFGSGFVIAYLRRPVRGDYRKALTDAQHGRAPDDGVRAMVLHSFSQDFEPVKAAFPFERTLVPPMYPDTPAFLVVWFDRPGNRLISLEEVRPVRKGAA